MKTFMILAVLVAVANCATFRVGSGQVGVHVPHVHQQVPVHHGQVGVVQGPHVQKPVVPVHHHDVVNQGQVPVQGSHVPQQVLQPIGIVHQESEVNPDGSFHNVWESENGIKVQEEGTVNVVDKDTVVQTVTGQVSYVDADGQQVSLRYIANENGFQPEGSHIPTPPPLPAAIARGLEYIRAHPYVEPTTVHKHA